MVKFILPEGHSLFLKSNRGVTRKLIAIVRTSKWNTLPRLALHKERLP